MIEAEKLTPEQIFSLQAQYEVGTAHMKDFNDKLKFFKYPERRMKTFETVHYETHLPEIEQVLKQLGKL